jgi:hypothetical protein
MVETMEEGAGWVWSGKHTGFAHGMFHYSVPPAGVRALGILPSYCEAVRKNG